MPLSAKLLPVLLVALAHVLPRTQPIKRLPVFLWFEE
jgi:hypothetical protein